MPPPSKGERLRAWVVALPHRIKDFGSVLWHAMGRFWRNNDLQASAALTYTTLLALVPLLTVTFAIFTAFPAYSRVREQAQTMLFEFLVPQVGQQVQGYASQFMANAAALTGFGAVGLAFSAILLFSSIEGAFNAIWRITEPRPLVLRVLSFWAVLTMAPLLLGASMSLSSSMAVDFHVFGGEAIEGFKLLVPGLFEAAAFTLMYLAIPNRAVRWRDALAGGLVAAVLMEVSKIGFVLYVTAFPTYETIYGALSVIPIFLVWLYTVWSIVLFGAEITATLPEWRAGRITEGGPEGLLSAHRIVVAVAILRELHRAAKLGVGIRQATLASRIPVGAVIIEGMLEQLQSARWVDRTARGAWIASRDLHTATIDDLRHSLGLALRGNLRTVGHLQAGWQARIADLFEQTELADSRILAVPLASLFEGHDDS